MDQNYDVLLHDSTYSVQYSFHKGSGRIVNIEINHDARTLTLSVETLQDSQLIMAIPQPLYYYALIGNTPGAVELYVHADGNDTPFEQLMDFKKSLVTYIVNIEKGTEQVMLGRRLP